MEIQTSDLVDLGRRLMELILRGSEVRPLSSVVGMGADGTATHYVDKLCDDEVLRFVAENDLPYNVISEESGFTDRGFDRNLLVDPLDGSFNAETGFPFYALSIADVGQNLASARYGFVMNLSTGDYFNAEKGKGAFRNGKQIRSSGRATNSYLGQLGKYPDRSMNPLVKVKGRIRSVGCASLELCLLAQGSADAVSYLGPGNYIRNVDVAAGYAILTEAGGYLFDSDKHPFDMGLDVQERKNLIAVRDPKILGVFL
ncbi:MAG: inositol monophosphatase family protein [Thermoplasmataceae archaeon]